jgi:polysaccharide biosynthesis protein PelA
MRRKVGSKGWRRARWLAAALATACVLVAAPARADSWAVYYADKAAPVEFVDYSLVVLDATHHPPLEPLKGMGKRLLGYISLGEVEQWRPYFAAVKAEGLVLGENPHWKGSFSVDVRDPRWTARVLDQLIPPILAKGFDGLFFDTLDNPPDLERRDPKRFAGMTRAAAELVRAIRARHPQATLMLNRAYEILPEIAAEIDIALGESVHADWDFAAKRYRLVAEAEYRHQVELLKAAQVRAPRLKVYTLDYWDPNDPAGIARIYAEQRRNGFSPYVATLKLDRLVPEPRAKRR